MAVRQIIPPGINSVEIRSGERTVVLTPEIGPRIDKILRQSVQAPQEAEFSEEGDFINAPSLRAIGEDLIKHHGRFGHLGPARLAYLWKRKGGTTKGRSKLGQCQLPSGLLAFFSEMDFVIWVAADHVRDNGLNAREIEAILFHELCHAGVNDKGEFCIDGHDVETFAAEIEEYGLWKSELRRIGKTIRQLPLDDILSEPRGMPAA